MNAPNATEYPNECASKETAKQKPTLTTKVVLGSIQAIDRAHRARHQEQANRDQYPRENRTACPWS